MRKQADWTTVRVNRRTLASLLRVRESMLVAGEQGQREIDWDNRNRWGLDKVIRELIAFRLRHARRRAQYAARRTPEAGPVDVGAIVEGAGPFRVSPNTQGP